jgi:hypothetical protein
MGAKLLTGTVLAVIGLFTIKLVMTVLAGVAAIVAFLLFTVLPLVIIGWIVLKLFRRSDERPAY